MNKDTQMQPAARIRSKIASVCRGSDTALVRIMHEKMLPITLFLGEQKFSAEVA